MSLRLISKASCLGVFGSTAYATTIIDIDIPDNNNTNSSFSPKISNDQKKQYSTMHPTKTTLEDVEMFEKHTGCKLIFTDSFEKNNGYSVRDWFNEKMKLDSSKREKWRSMFAYGVYYHKNKCGAGKVLTLEVQGEFKDQFNPKHL